MTDPSAYVIHLHAGARRAITDRLPEAVALACLTFIRGPLATNPQRVGAQLTGELAGFYSTRVGVYRIVYAIDEDKSLVQVIRVDHRANAYRRR